MSMTVMVTRNASMRLRGFLSSTMLEVSPGIFVGPRISPGVRQRIWSVVEEWFESEEHASIVMIWPDRGTPGGQAVSTLGVPPIDFVDIDGLVLARRAVL
jgi:CRISPR-associated protein Cas2